MSENLLKGLEFEQLVEQKLKEVFNDVKRGQTVVGFSGARWRLDFLVEGRLIVEASAQRRMETKLTQTFMKFKDICQVNPNYRCALVVDEFHNLIQGRHRKKKPPSTEILVMVAHGFPIVTADDIPKLKDFLKGVSAFEITKPPFGNIRYHRRQIEEKILSHLKERPMRKRDLVELLSLPKSIIRHALERLKKEGKIIQIGWLYGLNRDQVVSYRIKMRMFYRKEDAEWLEEKVIDYLRKNYVLRTAKFSVTLGINCKKVSWVIHCLSSKGLIRKISRGTWVLNKAEVDQPITVA